MKILVDTSNLRVGGGVQVAISFLRDLKTNISDLFVCVLSFPLTEEIKIDEYPGNFVFYNITASESGIFKRTAFLRQIERQHKPDVIFTVFGPTYLLSRTPKVVGYARPHYVYPESSFFHFISFRKRVLWKLRRWIHIFLFKRLSTALIFETEDARSRFVRLFKYDLANTYVVPNTLNMIFCNQTEWHPFKLTNDSQVRILVVSAKYPHKNLNIIPAVIDCLLKKNIKDFHFVVTLNSGDLEIDDQYRDYISFVGKVSLSQLPSLYQQCQIFFLPTVLEVFSTSYLEAMKMGLPICTSDLSFAKDICKEAALYFDPSSPSEISEALIRLIDSENLRDVLKNNGYQNLKMFKTSRERSQMYLQILRQTVQNHP